MSCTRYFGAAVAVGLLSAGGYHAYKHVGLPNWYWQARLPDAVEAIDAADTAKLKEVLFGGDPWLLQCYSGLPYAGQHLPAPFRLHQVLKESLPSLRGVARVGTVDCELPLPSNKTLVTKLGLVRRTQPLLILASAGSNPKQLPANAAGSPYSILAWVKPKAEPRVHKISTQQQLRATCGGRRSCLLTQLEPDSVVLQQLASRFRKLEVVSIPEESGAKLSWGRGEEVGETLEEEEAAHLGKRISFLALDPDAPPKKTQSAPARLLRGFGGAEDLPSISRFVSNALDAHGDDGFMRITLPTVNAPAKKPKKTVANDNAEVQARRAKKRAAARAREEAEAAERAAQQQQQSAQSEEQLQREREQRARARMAAEEAQAGNIVEEVDEDDEEDETEEDDNMLEDEDEDEVVDLDM